MAYGGKQLGSAQYGGSINALGPLTVVVTEVVTHVETITPTLTAPFAEVVTHVETFQVSPQFHESVTHTERLIASLNGTPWDLLWSKIAKTAADVWTKIAKP